MEKFRNTPNSRSAPETKSNSGEILNSWDREVLEYGLRNITKELLKDFGGQLPRAIVLPDTSARPLMYALRPAFERVIGEHGGAMPRFYFFRTDKPDFWIDVFESRHGRPPRSENELIQDRIAGIRKEEDLLGSKPRTAEELKAEIDEFVHSANFEDMLRVRAVMKARAEEIRKAEKKHGEQELSIAVIDEYASSDAATIRELRKAFGFRIPSYAVFSESNRRSVSGLNLDPWKEKASGNLNLDAQVAKFSYSQSNSVGVRKGEAGITKYARAIWSSDPAKAERIAQLKKKLRAEMKGVGTKVATTLDEDGYKSFHEKTGITDYNRPEPKTE